MAHASDAGRLGLVVGLMDAGTLAVLVDRPVPLAELGDALRYSGSGRARGKVLVAVGPVDR